MASLNISNATKKYDDLEVIHGIDLEIQDGEFCVFVGPSGCGKSTLLRMISGLEEVTSGQIHIGDRDVTYYAPCRQGNCNGISVLCAIPTYDREREHGLWTQNVKSSFK